MKIANRFGLAAAALAGFVAPLTVVGVEPASAYPSNCGAWVTSTGWPGGGFTGLCQTGSGQFRVVGVCKSLNPWSTGRWVYGPWVSIGSTSFVRCNLTELPQAYPFTQAR